MELAIDVDQDVGVAWIRECFMGAVSHGRHASAQTQDAVAGSRNVLLKSMLSEKIPIRRIVVTWVMDPELYELFAEELTERSAVLADGARAIEAGVVDEIDPEEMRREGHTIKGNGRVMGYDLIGTAGQVCEEIWGWIERQEIAASPALGAALLQLAEAIPVAVDKEAADLIPAIRAVHTALKGEWLPGELPVV